MGEPTQDDLNKYLNSLRPKLTSYITIDLLKDGIRKINGINANGDKEVTHQEIIDFLAPKVAAHFNTSSPNILENITERIKKDKAEQDCNAVAMYFHLDTAPELIANKENYLALLSNEAMSNPTLTSRIAGLVKSPDQKEELTIRFADVALYNTIGNFSIPPNRQQETAELLKAKVMEIGKEAVRDIERLLEANPKIKRALKELPDTSRLSVNADYTCQALFPTTGNEDVKTNATRDAKQTMSKR